MDWVAGISRAIDYIEGHLDGELTMEEIAGQALLSPFYFQRGFCMLCGFSVGEYIRLRRLSLAGSELASTDARVIDLALKYGYESPDSFAKAFARFHGATPTAVRRGGATVRTFAPLKLKFSMKGGPSMEYKIVDRDPFPVLGVSETFSYEEADRAIPQFWTEHLASGRGAVVQGTYGICIDEPMEGDRFEYLIADDCPPNAAAPEGFVVRVIPAHRWAVFPCKGAMPQALHRVHEQVFSEWLPTCGDYEIAAGYNIEWYSDPAQFPKGMDDEAYISEIWIPVRQK